MTKKNILILFFFLIHVNKSFALSDTKKFFFGILRINHSFFSEDQKNLDFYKNNYDIELEKKDKYFNSASLNLAQISIKNYYSNNLYLNIDLDLKKEIGIDTAFLSWNIRKVQIF